MIKKASLWFLAAVIVVGLATYANALPGRWVLLGSAHVDGGVDHDKIKVNSNQTFASIQFRVSGSAIKFDHVIVQYGNGQSETLQLRSQIPAGGESRAIDLPGARRQINRIDLWYEKAHWGAKPEVQVYGMP
jgi:hypothetical protein